MARTVREPVQARAVRSRRNVLRAARHLFSRRGFHGTRVDSVAARASVNKERIYAYFGSKQGLFVAVLQDAFMEMQQADESLLDASEADLPRLPERLLRHYMRFNAEHPYFWRLLSWENLEGGAHAKVLCDIREPSFRRLRVLYGRGQELGYFRVDVSFEAFILVVTSVAYFYYANMRTMSKTLGLDLESEAVRERLIGEALKQIQA